MKFKSNMGNYFSKIAYEMIPKLKLLLSTLYSE